MRSQRQIQASRLNGAKSRGPKTAAGKRRSAKNATKHNAYAEALLAKGENPRRFQKFLSQCMLEYQPTIQNQIEFVAKIAEITWRLLRVRRLLHLTGDVNLMTVLELEHIRLCWTLLHADKCFIAERTQANSAVISS